MEIVGPLGDGLGSAVVAGVSTLHASRFGWRTRRTLSQASDAFANTLPMSWNSTKLTVLPTQGSVGGGRRNSVLLISAPAPPMGYPVSGSRGPAELLPKPRSEVAPPA